MGLSDRAELNDSEHKGIRNLLAGAGWYLWQLPQNLLGLAYWKAMQRRHDGVHVLDPPPRDTQPVPPRPLPEKYTMIELPLPLFGGLSLGKYLFFGAAPSANLLAHERGHMIQSRRLGPFYLLVVGVPSVARSVYHRKRHSHWTSESKQEWYHRHWPESAADRHGGVKR